MISLVLLPGLDGTGLLFKPLIDRLPDDIEPIVMAYPKDRELGYGELLPLVLDSLPSGPFVLLGESFSGPLAVMAAHANPPGLRAVVLCATFVRSPAAWLPAWCRHAVRPFQFRLYPVVAHLRMMLGRFSDPSVRNLAVQVVANIRPAVIAHRIREVHQVNVSSQLGSCSVPVLYLRGDRDWLVPASAMRAVLSANAETQIARLDAPHMVLQTQPAAAAKAITAFIRSLQDRVR